MPDKRLKEETTTGEAHAIAGMGLNVVTPQATPGGDRKVATLTATPDRTAAQPAGHPESKHTTTQARNVGGYTVSYVAR
jgi:hypothetical protein